MAEALFIVWRKKYNTGILILDEQHRGLVSLINSFFFHRNDAKGDISKFLVPAVEMFKWYAKINFLTLEKLMEDSGYPELKKYRAMHMELLHNIIVMERKYRNARDVGGMLNFLKEYWLDYTCGEGKEYLPHLRAYYLKRPRPGMRRHGRPRMRRGRSSLASAAPDAAPQQ